MHTLRQFSEGMLYKNPHFDLFMSSQIPETENQQNITQNEAVVLNKQSEEATPASIENAAKKRQKQRPIKKIPTKAHKTTTEPAPAVAPSKKKTAREEKPKTRIRIRIAAYDNKVIDKSTKTIIDTAMRSGAEVIGPIPLPTDIKKFTGHKLDILLIPFAK